MRWAAAAITGALLVLPAAAIADPQIPAPRPAAAATAPASPDVVPAAAPAGEPVGTPATAGAVTMVPGEPQPAEFAWPTADRWAWTEMMRLPLRRPRPPTAAAVVPAAAPPPPAGAASPAAAGSAAVETTAGTAPGALRLPPPAPARPAAPAVTETAGTPPAVAGNAEVAVAASDAVTPPAPVAGQTAVALPRAAPARAAGMAPAAAAVATTGTDSPSSAAAAASGEAPAEAASGGKPAVLAYAAPAEARPSPRLGERERGAPYGRPPTAQRPPATPAPTAPGAAPIGTPSEPPRTAVAAAPPAGGGCAALLALGPAVVEPAPDLPQTGACGIERPVRLKAVKMPDGHLVALSPAAELRCDMAAAASAWLREDLIPALGTAGSPVAVVKVADDYSCRPRNRVRGARLSEHGRGNAIDIGGFKLADGRVLEVAGNGLPKPFRITMRATACARFMTILGPGSDGYHENHIHVDLAERRSKRSYCRWRIPGTDAS